MAELAHFLDELGARYTPGESPLCWQCLQGIRSKQVYSPMSADFQQTHLVCCKRWCPTFKSCAEPQHAD